MQTQLLPLLRISGDDGLTTRYCLRLISQLIIPLSDKAISHLNLKITDRKSNETKEEYLIRVNIQKKLKENATEQLLALIALKGVISSEDTLFHCICNTLIGPLRKEEKERTEGEIQIIETVLHILSNLSSIHAIGNSINLPEIVKSQELHCLLIEKFNVIYFILLFMIYY